MKRPWRALLFLVCRIEVDLGIAHNTGIVDAVERAAGLTLFSDEIKSGSKHICQTAKCEVIVKRFDDARKNAKQIAAPKS